MIVTPSPPQPFTRSIDQIRDCARWMRTVLSSSVSPSSRIPEIGIPWLVAGRGAAAGAAAPALAGCESAEATKVGVALGTAVGTSLGVALGSGVSLGAGVTVGVPP